MKKCRTCGIEKPLDGFHRHPATKDGRSLHCAACMNAARRALYATPEGKALRRGYQVAARAKGQAKEDATIEQRFWAKVDKGDGTGCWNWTGAKRWMGHGGIFYRGENRMAHRVSLILHGQDVPAHLVVDHICRNTSCVRPEHLRVVTPTVNALENNMSPMARNAAKKHCGRCGRDLDGPGVAILMVPVKKTHRGHPTDRLSRRRVCLHCWPHSHSSPHRIDHLSTPSQYTTEKP